MASRIRALVLYGSGLHWQAAASASFLGLLGRSSQDPLPLGLHRVDLYRRLFPYSGLSYVNDWREALIESPALVVDEADTMNLPGLFGRLKKIQEYDLVVILHSAAGDYMGVLSRIERRFLGRKCPLVVFFGNEYDLLEEKIAFVNNTDAQFLCSQLPLTAARFLYDQCPAARLLEMPHALNPKAYHDQGRPRTVDIGFIGALYHNLVGDRERTDFIEYFKNNGQRLGLSCDIRFGNVHREQWVDFLNECKGVAGAESGTYFLDKAGRTISAVKAHLKKHPDATTEELRSLYFDKHGPYVSGKAISSRHFEPIGTKTCQMLLEGNYNGILKPQVHYISVKKDLSDLGSAVEMFRDEGLRKKISQAAYDHVLENHTYGLRVESLLRSVFS